MASIIVLGGGIAGVTLAYEMKEKARSTDKVTLISDSATFHFVPSNPWVAVNWRTPEKIKIELAPYLAKKDIEFIHKAAKRLHPDENRIELEDGSDVTYDYLAITTGPRLAFDEIPGLGPVDGFTQSICHVDHAENAAAGWNKFVENPGPMIVGAAQLASCFGPAYEYAFIADTELRKQKVRNKVPMTLVTSEPFIGHLGLGGVGNSKDMLEGVLRDRHINWITNAKIDKVEDGTMFITEVDEAGEVKKNHELPFNYSMILPAFTGIDAVCDIEGLVNPRGFIIVDEYQRNPKYDNIFAAGVCIAITPPEATPVPTGVPKTGYMIESMVCATVQNIAQLLNGEQPTNTATWNAICLADMGDSGIAFVAMPQIPPRNVTWAKQGKWVHAAKVMFEKYYLRKVKTGKTDPAFERQILKMLGINKLDKCD